MSNLRLLRQRMKSIESISKVTAAMKLISTVTLRRAQHKLEVAAQYQKSMQDTLQTLVYNVDEKPALLDSIQDQDKPAIVAIFSDKGLCGAYNYLVASRAHYLMQHATDPELYIIGHKGISLLRAHDKHLKESHAIKAFHTYEPIKTLAAKLVQDFYAGTINRCVVVYTQFKSILATVPTEMTLFPITIDPNPILLYGTDPEDARVLQATAEQYVAAQLYYLVQQSMVSENAVRMFAMDNATKNADDILQTLSKVYHKTRQQNITQEIIEIMGGTEAL